MPPSTAPSVARNYDALRPKILERLIEMRASLDASLGRVDEAAARAHIDAVLERIGNFIATGDSGLYRAFLHTFMAMRAGEAQSPGAVLAMLVAIGDTAAQVGQELGDNELALMLTRVTASTARAVNDLIAEELERRTEQLGELRTKEQAALEPV
jgi:2-methylisocitrate lyase-like PEP mutase family enzyme